MKQLNKEAYEVTKDNLVYDGRHPLDAANVAVTSLPAEGGELKRGLVLDYYGGNYVPHGTGDSTYCAAAIVAESIAFGAGETEVTAAVYTSGSFRRSACIAGGDVEVTDMDAEELRSKGIYLK